MAGSVLPTATDGTTQVVFYDAGVGTEGNWLDRLRGMATGKGLEKNIRDCYFFLVHNYSDGDQIYLFGFSRGAYTVRSLAGLVRNCGVLKKSEAGRLPEAFRMYRRAHAAPESPEAKEFRSDYSREAEIAFIGVWDTVGSLGIPLRGLLWNWTMRNHKFHDVELSRSVKHGCHALAINEKRGPFRPSLWEAKPKPGQTVEQVWFLGAHDDIGGNSVDSPLTEASLEWMRERASSVGLDLGQAPWTRRSCPRSHSGVIGWRNRCFAKVMSIWNRCSFHTRVIGGDETQSVHSTARDSYMDNPASAPENLASYLSQPEARVYGETK